MNLHIPLQFVREEALKLGFQECGAAKAEKADHEYFDLWLKEGCHGAMHYMEKNKDKRLDPKELVPETETIFSFLISYNGNSEALSPNPIASYALGEDYHKVLKTKLYKLIQTIQTAYPDFQGRAFVDSAPLMERQWAERAGLGWIGKNGCLVNERFGSKTFLAEIVCNCQSDYSEKAKNRCGSCNRCVESCPNGAIRQNSLIDCRLCTSYQTIENKGDIPSSIQLDGYAYGCDICLNACIWNAKAERCCCEEFLPTPQMKNLISKLQTNNLEKSDFNRARKNSAMERIKYDKFLSNLSTLSKQQNSGLQILDPKNTLQKP